MQPHIEQVRPEHLRLGANGPEIAGEAAAVLQAFALIAYVEHGRAKQRRDYQLDQLALVLGHAQTQSAFWRARLPPGAASLADFPVLTRAELRGQITAEGALAVPPEHGDVDQANTSGATSEPLTFWSSSYSGAYNEARYCFDDVAGGRRLDCSLAVTTGKVKNFEDHDHWPTRTGMIWRTGPGVTMPLAGEHLETLLGRILDGPGGHVATRPAIVEALLIRAKESGRASPPFGEFLTYGELVTPALRAEVRDLFKARIADRYSVEEVGPIAFECRRSAAHYHVASSNVIVEVVDERRRPVADGKVGDLLLTGLHGLATPIIRYDIGDRAAQIARCPCGHDGPTLRALAGRRRSLIRLPDGRLFFFRPTVRDFEAIATVRQWRAIQTGPSALTMEVVVPDPLTDDQQARLAVLVRRLTAPDFAVTVRQVPAIDWGPSGKRMLVRNLMEDARD